MEENKKTNPNGANQYLLDPRQKLCWDYYVNPRSETFGSGRASAIKAGYEEEYANQITVSEWFIVKLRRLNMLNKSEKVLEEDLDMNTLSVKEVNGEQIIGIDPQLRSIRQKAATFVASTQGKDEGYSTRTENTGKDGGAIEFKPITGMIISKDNEI